MSSDALFQRFVQGTPITVMVRSTLEYALAPATIDAIFAESSIRQREGELLFSSVVNLLALVVWRQRDSVRQAYEETEEKFGVSVRSVYNKLNGTETEVCRALVRDTAAKFLEVADVLGGKDQPLLPGFRARIIDGNHLTSTDHRLQPLRTTRSGPLPGQVLAVLDPDRMLIVDMFACEDGQAQERIMFPEVIPSAQANDLWIADRNFCTTRFLFGLARKGAYFVIRQHQSTLSWDEETELKKLGRCEKGTIYEQKLYLRDGKDKLVVRRITIKLDKPTRKGETEVHVLTNLSQQDANARKVAQLYLHRWTIENAFQEVEQSLRSEINTLGYPGAALLGFSIAVLTYNVLSLVKWAIVHEHADQIERQQISAYYMAGAVKSDHGGMMIAIPRPHWMKRFSTITPSALAEHLRMCARHVRTDAYRKNVRGPKKPRPPRSSGRTNHHVATARLLAKQKVLASQG